MMATGVTKTRVILIEVARQLFARLGYDGTGMNDISQASRRGRRTLYTYFNSKDEIYAAVIESEVDRLLEVGSEVIEGVSPADEKLITYIFMRMDAIKGAVYRNGTLRAEFFRDISRVERARRRFDEREREVLREILSAGVSEGIFALPDVGLMADLLHYALKGWEIPYIRGILDRAGVEWMVQKASVMQLLLSGIRTDTADADANARVAELAEASEASEPAEASLL
jgi:AcrR family transcriptional regulator